MTSFSVKEGNINIHIYYEFLQKKLVYYVFTNYNRFHICCIGLSVLFLLVNDYNVTKVSLCSSSIQFKNPHPYLAYDYDPCTN